MLSVQGSLQPFSPAVMLSPNARTRVPTSFGIGGAGTTTITSSEQVACRLIASIAVHVTVVLPAGNVVPDAGAQLDVTGGVPPLAVGLPYVTAADVIDDDAVVTLT